MKRAAGNKRRAFTLVEALIVVAVLATLAAITIAVYTGVQRQSMEALVLRTASDAQKTLSTYNVFNRNYPSNIANTDYAPPLEVALALYTDAPQMPVYHELTADENAQLFLNTCNGFMPIVDGGISYNTSCAYAGNNLHVKGTVTSNVVLKGPTIQQTDIDLSCGAACDAARNSIITTFLAQGGTFPIAVPKKGSTLPAPTMESTGEATRFCLEARSPRYADIVFHVTPGSNAPEPGACPTDAGLHYP